MIHSGYLEKSTSHAKLLSQESSNIPMVDMDIGAYRNMVEAQLNNLLGRKDMIVSLDDNGPNIVHVEATEPISGESIETIWSVDNSFNSDFMSGGHTRLAKILLGMLRTRGLINEGIL
jgi:hypothetical protein